MASGRKKHRLSADQIAARRYIVKHFHQMGMTAPEIAAAILDNPETTHLLSSQADKVQVIYDDQLAMREQAVTDFRTYNPLRDWNDYRERKQKLLKLAYELMHDDALAPMVRARWASEYSRTADDLARSGGIPVGNPAISINLNDLRTMRWDDTASARLVGDDDTEMIEGEVLATSSGSSGFGLVDAYTFATHEDYCALDLRDKPMQQSILMEFMRGGSGYGELVDICGMRSGKGTIGSVIVWYAVYQLIEMQNPQRYYGLTSGQAIGTVNMAVAEQQAKDNVFKHIKDRLHHGGRWFRELRDYCERHIRNYELDLELRLPKNISMKCGHSRASSKVGGTNIAVVFDEISKYKDTQGRDNADDTYAQMKATTATFGEDAIVASLSSPEWTGDKGMQLLKMALERDDMPLEERCDACRPRSEAPDYEPTPTKSHPRLYGIHMPTWDANTALSYERLWDLQNGAANPGAFWRDFGARPAEAKEGYYQDPARWDRQACPDLNYPYNKEGQLEAGWKPCCDAKRFAHVDLGQTRDAAGIAMSHQPVPGCPFRDRYDVVVDLATQRRPQFSKHGTEVEEIDFENIRQILRDWQERGFNLKSGKVTYDGFQSVDSRQKLRKEGFRAELFSVDRNLEPHDTVMEMVNTDRLGYWGHPVLIREAKQLQLLNGRKVDHPPKGSKDVYDAVAASAYHAKMFGGRVVFIGGSANTQQPTEKDEQPTDNILAAGRPTIGARPDAAESANL